MITPARSLFKTPKTLPESFEVKGCSSLARDIFYPGFTNNGLSIIHKNNLIAYKKYKIDAPQYIPERPSPAI